MSLANLRTRRFYGSRYFGDGRYPTQPQGFFLIDQVTQAIYQLDVTSSGEPSPLLIFLPAGIPRDQTAEQSMFFPEIDPVTEEETGFSIEAVVVSGVLMVVNGGFPVPGRTRPIIIVKNSVSRVIKLRKGQLPAQPLPISAPNVMNVTSDLAATQVTLDWSASQTPSPASIMTYFVERCDGSGCTSFVQIAAVSNTVLSFVDTTVSPSTLYRYRVRSVNTLGTFSAYGAIGEITTPTVGPFPVTFEANGVGLTFFACDGFTTPRNILVTYLPPTFSPALAVGKTCDVMVDMGGGGFSPWTGTAPVNPNVPSLPRFTIIAAWCFLAPNNYTFELERSPNGPGLSSHGMVRINP